MHRYKYYSQEALNNSPEYGYFSPMNTNNLAQKTNFIAGSDKFERVPFYLTTVNIPGLTLSHPRIGGRAGTQLNLSGDTIEWGSLAFDMLIDEDFEVYKELMQIIRRNIQAPEGTFSDFYFDFWIEVSNSKGHKVLKMEFSNCRIESIGDITLDSQDESTEHVLPIGMAFDYYEVEDNPSYTLRQGEPSILVPGKESIRDHLGV